MTPEEVAHRAVMVLLRREHAAGRQLAGMYRRMLVQLRPHIRAVADRVAATPDVPIGETREYEELVAAVAAATSIWSSAAADETAAAQDWAAGHGITTGGLLVAGVGGTVALSTMRRREIRDRVVRAAPDIRESFRRLPTLVADQLHRYVTSTGSRAVSVREIGRIVRDLPGRGRRIMRTEMLRSYRDATRTVFDDTPDVVGWRWLSTRSSSTCAACWAMDGKVFPTRQQMPAHPNCRCTMVPVLAGTESEPSGQDTFDTLPDDVQARILGGPAYRAWQDGAVTLDDLVGTTRSDTWGDTVQVRSVRQILGPDAAARYYRRT